MAKKAIRKARPSTRRPARKPAAKTSDASAAIRRLDAEFMQAAGARDAGALVKAFYAADAALMPPNHPLVTGRTAIQGFLQGLIDGGLTSVKLETRVTASAGDLAYGRGRYTLSLSPAGATPVEDVGKYVVVYRRQADGTWRAVADIFNSDHPAA
jgi:ketosteroid isomerase-like protein